MHLPGLQSEGPPHVFQLMGFICACHVVSVITKEEDSCKCVTTSLLQNPIIDLPAPPGSGGGEERLQAGHLAELAAHTPQVHRVAVEAIGEETLGLVPVGGDVLHVRLLRVDTGTT